MMKYFVSFKLRVAIFYAFELFYRKKTRTDWNLFKCTGVDRK